MPDTGTYIQSSEFRGQIQRKAWCMVPCSGVDFNLTLPYVHSRVDSKTFIMDNPMPESTSTLCQSRLYPPVRDWIWPQKMDLLEFLFVSFDLAKKLCDMG